jgi:2-polyprenyl-6-methoxyphenol hydroxylase-like FAD-dependent oxidoreductase
LAPNANGVLRKWGIFAEDFGATLMHHMEERTEKGDKVKDIDLRGVNTMWQHPWHLSHRVNLHDKLKEVATAEEGDGPPARLHTSSKIVRVDADKGQATLADGRTVTSDVILGADGIYVSVVNS